MTTAGLDSIRNATRASMAGLIQNTHDIGVSASTLEAFADGRATLQPATLDKLVSFLWSGLFVFDHTAGTLRSKMSQQPIATLGAMPDKAQSAKAYADPLGKKVDVPVLTTDPDRDTAKRIKSFLGLQSTSRQESTIGPRPARTADQIIAGG